MARHVLHHRSRRRTRAPQERCPYRYDDGRWCRGTLSPIDRDRKGKPLLECNKCGRRCTADAVKGAELERLRED